MGEKFTGRYRCTRCYGLGLSNPGMVCDKCLLSLNARPVPRHYPQDPDMNPHQENAIRAWEDGG